MMKSCANCKGEVSGRFCTSCGRDSAIDQGPTIEVPAVAVGGGLGVQPAVVREPGYVAPMAGAPIQSMGSTANNQFTHDAEFLLRSTGERIAWQGKPSMLILMPRLAAWGAVLLVSLPIAAVLNHGVGFFLLCVLVGGAHIGAGYLNWRNTTYRVTSQRLEYSSGVLSCTTATNPLSHIGNVTILRPFPWNLMGLGHLELDIPDQASRQRAGVRGRVVLRCLQHLETTRDLIHSSSTIVNQAWDQRRYAR